MTGALTVYLALPVAFCVVWAVLSVAADLDRTEARRADRHDNRQEQP